MQLHNLYPFPEERKTRRRVGRGAGSGLGCTSGKGHKGQNARAGGGVRPGFEGGQMPLQRRLPKHGFKNYPFKVTYGVVHVGDLIARFPDEEKITLEMIYTFGLCKPSLPCKVLAGGEVTKAVTIEAYRFSASAAEQIEKAGGKALSLELGQVE